MPPGFAAGRRINEISLLARHHAGPGAVSSVSPVFQPACMGWGDLLSKFTGRRERGAKQWQSHVDCGYNWS